jgi:class 3 adenylate cyclase
LADSGGQLSAYGLPKLQTGKSVGEQIIFLEGILPLDNSPLFLPCVKTDYGRAADIHIFPGNEGYWVLLLDATLEEVQQGIIQQQGNDLKLLRQEHTRVLNKILAQEMPQNLAEKLVNLRQEGERRNVTILLANLCGITAYSENNPPEVVFRVLNIYFTNIIQQILDEAGWVEQIFGDAIAALFGILPATESPPKQALKAALNTMDIVRDIGTTWQLDGGLTLDLSIGIASGPVALGLMGSKDRKTLNAIGYYVNLANKLGIQARAGEILIDENTFNKIEGQQENFSETFLLLQGMVEPMRIYSCLVR